jgi:hypothetical protein
LPVAVRACGVRGPRFFRLLPASSFAAAFLRDAMWSLRW